MKHRDNFVNSNPGIDEYTKLCIPCSGIPSESNTTSYENQNLPFGGLYSGNWSNGLVYISNNAKNIIYVQPNYDVTYLSTDYGASKTAVLVSTGSYINISPPADFGNIVYSYNGYIYYTSNLFATSVQRVAASTLISSPYGLICKNSLDGTKAYCIGAYYQSSDTLRISSDNGVTWQNTATAMNAAHTTWNNANGGVSIAWIVTDLDMSSNGQNIVIPVIRIQPEGSRGYSYMFVSNDGGASFVYKGKSTGFSGGAILISEDGTGMITYGGCGNWGNTSNHYCDGMMISHNSGTTWTATDPLLTGPNYRRFTKSSDGSILVISSDSGGKIAYLPGTGSTFGNESGWQVISPLSSGYYYDGLGMIWDMSSGVSGTTIPSSGYLYKVLNYSNLTANYSFTSVTPSYLSDSSFFNHSVTTPGDSIPLQILPSAFNSSAYLCGDGKYIQIENSADWNFSSDTRGPDSFKFCIDLRVYPTSSNPYGSFYSQYSNTSYYVVFRSFNNGSTPTLQFKVANGSIIADYTFPYTLTQNTWTHLSAIRDDSGIKIKVNGIDQAVTVNTAIGSSSMPSLAAPVWIGRDPLSVSGNLPFPSNTVAHLLLEQSGNSFVDDIGKTVTNTSVVSSTTNVKWGTYSAYFNGSSYLSLGTNNDWAFGTSNFFIGFWYWGAGQGTTYPGVVALPRPGRAVGEWRFDTYWNGNNLGFYYKQSSSYSDNHTGVNVNDSAWHYLCISRTGDRMRLYKDGVAQTFGSTPYFDVPSGQIIGANDGSLEIGRNGNDGIQYQTCYLDDLIIVNGNNNGWNSNSHVSLVPPSAYNNGVLSETFFPGYMQEIRVSKGTDRQDIRTGKWNKIDSTKDSYSSLPSTSILYLPLNESANAFTDHSGTGKGVIVYNGGPVSSSSQSKFYSSSARFTNKTDGNNHQLNVDSLGILGGGNFVIHFWIYKTSADSGGFYDPLFTTNTATATTNTLMLRKDALYCKTNWGGIAGYGSNLSLNVWHHIAVVRSGSDAHVFVDGTRVGTGNVGSSHIGGGVEPGFYINAGIFGTGDLGPDAYYQEFTVLSGTDNGWTGTSISVPMKQYNTEISSTTGDKPSRPYSEKAYQYGIDKYVKLFLAGNSLSLDESFHNKTVTNSSSSLSTTNSKFLGSSINTSSGFIRGPSNDSDFVFGTRSFVIDFWLKASSTTTSCLFCLWNSSGAPTYTMALTQSGISVGLFMSSNGYSWNLFNTTLANLSASDQIAWGHMALVRSGTSLHLFYNGTRVYTYAGLSASIYQTSDASLVIGGWHPSTGIGSFQGNICQFRVSMDTDRGWTGSSISVPTFPYSRPSQITTELTGNISVPSPIFLSANNYHSASRFNDSPNNGYFILNNSLQKNKNSAFVQDSTDYTSPSVDSSCSIIKHQNIPLTIDMINNIAIISMNFYYDSSNDILTKPVFQLYSSGLSAIRLWVTSTTVKINFNTGTKEHAFTVPAFSVGWHHLLAHFSCLTDGSLVANSFVGVDGIVYRTSSASGTSTITLGTSSVLLYAPMTDVAVLDRLNTIPSTYSVNDLSNL